MCHTVPSHMFPVEVAKRLQKPPYNWQGANGYTLARKYAALISISWNELKSIDDTAAIVDRTYMDETAPKNVALPTRESMERVGCKFIKVS